MHLHQSDVTGTVNMSNPTGVAEAVCAIIGNCYGSDSVGPLQQGFLDLEAAFWGRWPGLLPCDTPYHDLRHSMGTALLLARMVAGYERARPADLPSLGRDEGVLAVLLALFHDIGFLRREDESHINGACLAPEHERRGVEFMRQYLANTPLAHLRQQAELIQVTNFSARVDHTLAGLPQHLFIMGQMLGSSDLISQIASRYYLERCRYHLYAEFVAAGADRKTLPNGDIVMVYASAEDLLRKTPGFYKHMAKPRLEGEFDHAARFIKAHFDGDDPYERGIRRNLAFLQGMIEMNDYSGLNRKPVPLIPASLSAQRTTTTASPAAGT